MKHISYSIDNYVPTKEVSLNILDNFLTVVRGYQVFTVLKTVNKGRPIFLNYHLDRVLDNAQSMNMIVSQTRDEIENIIENTLQQNNFDNGECNLLILLAGTKPTDTSGLMTNMPVNLFVITTPIKEITTSYQQGVSLGFFDYRKSDSELKTPFTYFGGLKAQHALVRNGECDEALYTCDNIVLEGTTFSFFCVLNDNTILTSPADGKILKSVTRKVVLQLLEKNKYNFIERALTKKEVMNCKEAFIASSNRDIIPVKSIEGKVLFKNDSMGLITKAITKLYQDCISRL